MNNYTIALSSFIRFDAVVFNTLEYAMKKDSYDINAYNVRKNILTTEISQQTPLKTCCDNSKEAGEGLLKKINELIDLIYSENSTIVRVTQDGNEIRVDYSQAIAIFEAVMPIHEEVRKIIIAHVAAAQKEEKLEDGLLEIIDKQEFFYRGLINMLMLHELDHQFAEYNKARQEAKGGITAQSNFIQQYINRLVSLFRFSRENAMPRNADYYEMIDPLFALIEMTGGRRELPEGKNFGNVFNDVTTIVKEKVAKWEKAWSDIYHPYMNHFGEEIAKMQQQNKEKPADEGAQA